MTHAGVPDQTITKVLDGMAGNRDALIAGFPLFRGLDPAKFYKEGIHAPFHPATVAWAKNR